jgi:hypothetical protein
MPYSPKKDLSIFHQLLEILLRRSFRLWREGKDIERKDLNEKSLFNHQYWIEAFPPIKLGQLEKMFKGKTSNSLLLERKIHLPPLSFDSEFIPILSADLDLDRTPPALHFRVEMYRYKSTSGCKPQAVAFRFECEDQKSVHGYYHAQFTAEVHGTSLPDCPKWIPQHIPCFPLITNSSAVSVLFCVLVSLYGKGLYPKIFRGVNIDNKYTNSLRHILWPPKIQ